MGPDGRDGREDDLSVRFWGTRGSLPMPGPDTVVYGGNTCCVEIRLGRRLFIVDAGRAGGGAAAAGPRAGGWRRRAAQAGRRA